MESLVTYLKPTCIIMAIILSIFYGIRATFVDRIKYNGGHKRTASFFNFTYVFIFHFLGSALGWLLLSALIMRIYPIYPDMNKLQLLDLVLLLFGYLGVTGHIPQTLYGFVTSFGKIAESITNKITK